MESGILLAVVSVAIAAAIAIAVIMALSGREDRFDRRRALSAGRTSDVSGPPQPDARRTPIRIVPLGREDGMRFAHAWHVLQIRFLDDACGAVAEADRLLGEVMDARGYPLGEIDAYATDISACQPRIVPNYRAARELALRLDRGAASLQDLRTAFVHYHALFHDLLRLDHTERLGARGREPGGRQAV
jgi:hypothetical protein